MDAFFKHYDSLFNQPVPTVSLDELLQFILVLCDDDRSMSDGKITLSGVPRAIDLVPCGKSPRPDGLSAEFYKQYKKLLAPILLNIFFPAFEQNDLLLPFYKGHMVLI